MKTIFLYKVHKPYRMLSQLFSNNEREQRKKAFLDTIEGFPEKGMPIGRLDEKSEGLLLITNCGKLSDTINRSGIEKEYLAQLDGEITEEAIQKLQDGIEIGVSGKLYITKPSIVSRVLDEPDLGPPDVSIRVGRHNRPNSWVSITITEGKFRQVRKMTSAVGFPTLRLVRIRIGDIHLKRMKPCTIEKVEDSETILFSNKLKD